MDEESELLAEGMIGVIEWIKGDSSVAAPMIVEQMVAFGRGMETLSFIFFLGILAVGCVALFNGFVVGSRFMWKDLNAWLPQLIIGVVGVTLGLTLSLTKAPSVVKVWCAPRMYVIEEITEVAIYRDVKIR